MSDTAHPQRLLRLVHDRTGDLFVSFEPAEELPLAPGFGPPQLKPVEPSPEEMEWEDGDFATLRAAVVALVDGDPVASALTEAIAARTGVTADCLTESEAADTTLFVPSYSMVVVIVGDTTNRMYLDLLEVDLRNSHPDASLFVLTNEIEGRKALGRRAQKARLAKWADGMADELLGDCMIGFERLPGR